MVKIPDPGKTLFRASTYIYLIILTYMLLKPRMPEGGLTGSIPGTVLHTGAFLVLGFLVHMGWKKERTWTRIKAGSYTFMIAIILETLQLIVPGRSFSLIDIGSNLLGLFLGVVAALLIITITEKEEKEPSPE